MLLPGAASELIFKVSEDEVAPNAAGDQGSHGECRGHAGRRHWPCAPSASARAPATGTRRVEVAAGRPARSPRSCSALVPDRACDFDTKHDLPGAGFGARRATGRVQASRPGVAWAPAIVGLVAALGVAR